MILDGTSQLSVGRDRTASPPCCRQRASRRRRVCSSPPTRRAGRCSGCRARASRPIPSAVAQGTLAPTHAAGRRAAVGQPAAGGRRQRRPGAGARHRAADFGCNPPIGDLDREYGRNPAAVSSHGNAVAAGAGRGRRRRHRQALPRAGPGHRQHRPDDAACPTRSPPATTPTSRRSRPRSGRRAVRDGVDGDLHPHRPGPPGRVLAHRRHRHAAPATWASAASSSATTWASPSRSAATSIGERAVDFVAAGGDIVLTVDATQAADDDRGPAGPGRAATRRSRPRSTRPRCACCRPSRPAACCTDDRADQASSCAYAGLICSLMISSRSSNGMNALFIALIVNHCRSAQP